MRWILVGIGSIMVIAALVLSGYQTSIDRANALNQQHVEPRNQSLTPDSGYTGDGATKADDTTKMTMFILAILGFLIGIIGVFSGRDTE